MHASADAYARLLEAAARLFGPALAKQLGLDHTGPMDRALGRRVTAQLRAQPQSSVVDDADSSG
jgi:hypothetical protein